MHGKELYDSLTTEQLEYLKDRAGYFWSVEGEYGFSMLYSPVLLEVFITNPKHIFQSTDDKIYVTLEEYSVTDESLYLSLFGTSKNEEKHDTSFEVYEINNGKEKLIKKYIGRKEKCGSKDYP